MPRGFELIDIGASVRCTVFYVGGAFVSRVSSSISGARSSQTRSPGERCRTGEVRLHGVGPCTGCAGIGVLLCVFRLLLVVSDVLGGRTKEALAHRSYEPIGFGGSL